MRAGALDGLSIGFRARRATRDARTGQRRLHEIDLWEISIVTFPMLPGARVNGVKSGADGSMFPRPAATGARRSLPARSVRPSGTIGSRTARPLPGAPRDPAGRGI